MRIIFFYIYIFFSARNVNQNKVALQSSVVCKATNTHCASRNNAVSDDL